MLTKTHPLSKLRTSLEEKITQLYSEPEASFLAGILLGGDDRMEEKIRQNFIKTGMIHVVAVSGFNITILGAVFLGLAIFIGFFRRSAFWIALVEIWIFLAMIDFPSSGVRAGVMGSLLLWAARLGRLASSNRALLLAAGIMVFISPLVLFYDIGFQLSFLAAWGIINIYAPLAEKVEIKNDFLDIKSIFLTSFAAQLGVLGILIYNFNTFSLASFLANIIILPFVPVIMLLGFVSIMIAFLFFPLAMVIAFVTEKALELQIAVIGFFSNFSFSQIKISGLGIFWLLGYYLFVFLWSLSLRRKIIFKNGPIKEGLKEG